VNPSTPGHCYALFPYREPVVSMIKKLKFKHDLSYANALAALLISQIKQEWYQNKSLPDLIIPVPLHTSRLMERGFNQALEIGRYLGRHLDIALDARSVTRNKPTLAQSGLSKTARAANMRNAFSCQTRFDGLSIAILDDVVTTGQTVTELSRIISQQGAKHIDIWCCARA